MKKIQKMCFLALVGLMVGTSCEKTNDPDPQTDCIEGVVIAERRGTNPDPSLSYSCRTIVQIKNRSIGVQIGNYDNCVIIKNLDVNLAKLNQKVYFRTFTDVPETEGRTDCFANIDKVINATDISTQCNPK